MLSEFSQFEIVTGLPEIVAYTFSFVFGGSCRELPERRYTRIRTEASIIFPNSACPKCGTAIKAYDNVPILNWLILGGKCRGCKAPISARYPAVELLTGFVRACLLANWLYAASPGLHGARLGNRLSNVHRHRAHDPTQCHYVPAASICFSGSDRISASILGKLF